MVGDIVDSLKSFLQTLYDMSFFKPVKRESTSPLDGKNEKLS